MQPTSYLAQGGIHITREIRNHDYQPADTALARALDERRGVLFSSSFEFPGRYTRWDMGFVDPPLVFTTRGRRFAIEALNERGVILLDPIAQSLGSLDAARIERTCRERLSGKVEETHDRNRRMEDDAASDLIVVDAGAQENCRRTGIRAHPGFISRVAMPGQV